MMLTVKEVAKELGLSQMKVYKMINDGELRAIVVAGKKNRRLRIEEDDLDMFKLKRQTRKKINANGV